MRIKDERWVTETIAFKDLSIGDVFVFSEGDDDIFLKISCDTTSFNIFNLTAKAVDMTYAKNSRCIKLNATLTIKNQAVSFNIRLGGGTLVKMN